MGEYVGYDSYQGHPDIVWERELLRRVATTMLISSDLTYEFLMRQYYKHPTNEIKKDMEEVDEIAYTLWTALIHDLDGATKQ